MSTAFFEWQIAEERKGVLDTVLHVPSTTSEGEKLYQQVISWWNNCGVSYDPLYEDENYDRKESKRKVNRILVPWQYYPDACSALLQAPEQYKKLRKVRVLPRSMYETILEKQDGGYEIDEKTWPQECKTRWSHIPETVCTKLYPFQRETIELAWKRRGRMLIAHDMGLGKTLQAICVATGYRDEWPLLVVCLGSLKGTWKDAWMEWMQQESVIFKDSKDVPVQLKKNKSVYIISFDLLKRPDVTTAIADHKFKCVIIDEIHLLQSRDSQRTKACKKLFQKKCKRVIALSGTPAERPADLYPLLNIIIPELFPRWWAPLPRGIKTWDQARAFVPSEQYQTFALRYCDPQPEVYRDNVRYNHKGSNRLRELSDILRHFFYSRKTKSECATDLPPKIRKKVMLQVQDPLKQSFLEEEMDKLKKLQQEKKEALEAMSKKNEKKQSLVGATAADTKFIEIQGNKKKSIVENKEKERRFQLMHIWRSVLQQVKLPITLDYLRERFGPESGFRFSAKKIIIFAYHEENLTPICNLLENELKYQYIRIDGKVPAAQRHNLCGKYCQDPNVRFAVLSVLAAGTGLNLQVTDEVIFAELYWTAKHSMQAEDRAHRIGGTKNVLINYLILDKSVEPSIWKGVNAKQTVQNIMFDTRSLTDRQNNVPSKFLPTFAAKTVQYTPAATSSSSSSCSSSSSSPDGKDLELLKPLEQFMLMKAESETTTEKQDTEQNQFDDLIESIMNEEQMDIMMKI